MAVVVFFDEQADFGEREWAALRERLASASSVGEQLHRLRNRVDQLLAEKTHAEEEARYWKRVAEESERQLNNVLRGLNPDGSLRETAEVETCDE
jgi:hypothetical protein